MYRQSLERSSQQAWSSALCVQQISMTHTPSCIYMLRTATEATLGARCHTYLFAPPVRKCTDDKYDSCSTVLLSSTCIVVYIGHMREDIVATITCTCERNATGRQDRYYVLCMSRIRGRTLRLTTCDELEQRWTSTFLNNKTTSSTEHLSYAR